MLNTPTGGFALFVGQVGNNGGSFPFEVWVNGADQPRGLGAVAKTLSMDMRANDRGWLKLKLDTLARTVGERLKTIEDGVSQLRELSAAEVAVALRELFALAA